MKALFLWFIMFICVCYAWYRSEAALVEPKPAYYIEYSIADLNKDGTVNMLDQAIFAKEYLKSKKQLTYTDANNLQGLPVFYCPNMPASEFEEHIK